MGALNLTLDFDFIEKAAAEAKYMQWYAAFRLMLSLIWIYVYVLRLIAQLRSRIGVNRVPTAQRPQGKGEANRDKG